MLEALADVNDEADMLQLIDSTIVRARHSGAGEGGSSPRLFDRTGRRLAELERSMLFFGCPVCNILPPSKPDGRAVQMAP
jgi:hypothetical protein